MPPTLGYALLDALARSGVPGAARLVILRAKHVLHPGEKGPVFILEERVREADGGERYEPLLLLLLLSLIGSCFAHGAHSVKLVLFKLI